MRNELEPAPPDGRKQGDNAGEISDLWPAVILASILHDLLNMETFKDLISSRQPVLVDFYADWCGPCKTMSPVIQEVARATEGRARVIKVDIDKSAKAAQAYGIQAVPTFIIFKNGDIVWRHSGIIDKNSLVSLLQQHSLAQ